MTEDDSTRELGAAMEGIVKERFEVEFQTHYLKTHPAPFATVWDGSKTAEFRLNDRDFKKGDQIWLTEWLPDEEEYTGRRIVIWITHMQTGYGIPDGYCMLSFGYRSCGRTLTDLLHKLAKDDKAQILSPGQLEEARRRWRFDNEHE